jgi:MYXO-CTERM domain-containing protein
LGACVNDSAIPCAPYVCRDVNGAQQCTNPCSEDNDCQDGYYCVEKDCKKKLAPGAVCDSSAICASGFCVDGVCCDVSCKGQCEACDVAGSEGVCSPVQGIPHNMRPACDHAGDECGGQCDGVNSNVCKYAAVGTTCGTTACNNDLATSSTCNGQGECKPNKDQECTPYVCGTDDTCLSRCEQDADCSQGYTCDETTQRCLPSAVTATCSEDKQASVGQNGQTTPCKPFLCVEATGTCAVSCAFTTDCAPDFVCEPSTKTCLPAPPDSGTGDDESCACRAAGATPNRSGYWALAALGLTLTGLRRRRRARPQLAKPSRSAQDSHPFE